MLTIYHSNQLDLLKSLIAALMEREPQADIFSPEIVLVQSPGMAQWLQMQLAEQFSIAANIQFSLPASFIWQMFTHVLDDIPQESAFSKESMTWKLMHLIEEQDFPQLADYLGQAGDKRKSYQLAARVADLYDQYLVYRPDWIKQWENNQLVEGLADAQQWQAPLWRALIQYTIELNQPVWHRANLYQRFIESLADSGRTFPALPKRVFIFGIAALPPVYLQALQALSRHMDIHLMFTNPCRWYWGEIKDQKWLAKLALRQRKHHLTGKPSAFFIQPDQAGGLFNSDGELQQSNPLLASWGKLGRDNLFLLQDLSETQQIDAFVDLNQSQLLQRIQQDILDLEDHSVIGDSLETLIDSYRKRLLSPEDRSISINACHSALREVEVLQDYLLALLDKEPDLNPRDIIVMVADIDNYTPYIQSVFGHVADERYLPFSISDRKMRQAHPIFQAFLALLNMNHSRFGAEEVLQLLAIPAMSKKFAINETSLNTLRKWVAESGICWGLDDDNIRQLELPITGKNSWHFGLTRMLLGYAMNSESGIWQGILPYDESSGLVAELVGQLADFLTQLSRWRLCLAQDKTLEQWLPLGRELLDSFFAADEETEALLLFIEQQWLSFITTALAANYQNPLPAIVLHDDLVARLDQSHISQRFLAGQINFCTLMPMRSIPFKVVCLLGMNDGVYPRVIPPLGFDLMSTEAKRGDRSRRDDDRYLFLEALLSAQDNFYISYIGRSIQDNSERYPSVLVTELIDYISQSFVLPEDQKLDIDASARAVEQWLIRQHNRVPFSPDNFIAGSELQSYARQWLPAAEKQGKPQAAFFSRLASEQENEISLDQLIRFYRHPIRAFFQQRLGVYFNFEEQQLADQEPFELDNLQRYQLNQQLLNALLSGADINQQFERAVAAGVLPYGASGEIFWQQQSQDMQQLADTITDYKQESGSIEVALKLGKYQLSGWLHQVQSNGLLRWRPANLSIIDGLTLWIEHLVYLASGHSGESRMFGRKGSQWQLSCLTQQGAREQLTDLIEGMQQGLSEPLLFLPRSGWGWVEKAYDEKNRAVIEDQSVLSRATDQLVQIWQGSDFSQGEGNDYAIKRVMPHLNDANVKAIIQSAQRFLLPLRQSLISFK